MPTSSFIQKFTVTDPELIEKLKSDIENTPVTVAPKKRDRAESVKRLIAKHKGAFDRLSKA